jgi:hypothetical protein
MVEGLASGDAEPEMKQPSRKLFQASFRRISSPLSDYWEHTGRWHMTRKLLLIGAAVGFCLGAADLAAQEPGSALKPGDHIRVHRVAEGDVVTGKFVGRNATELQLVSDSAQTSISIPLAEVTKVERSTGKHGHTLVGLGVGAGVGLGLGLAGAASTGPNDFVEIGTGEVAVFTAVFGAAGALLGTVIRSDTWVEVPVATIELPPAAPGDTTTPIGAPIAAEH